MNANLTDTLAVLTADPHDEKPPTAVTSAPLQLRNILVPTDFSDCSRKALQYAVPLAKQHGAAVTLLHVVPIPPYAVGEVSGGDYIPSCLRTSGEQELTHLVNEFVRGEVTADTAVRNGTAATEIIELAKSLPADLVVISTHGRNGLKHFFMGSVAELVVRHSPCPVLVVHA
jgi:nucleotide-binding universal stress UspA family protein